MTRDASDAPVDLVLGSEPVRFGRVAFLGVTLTLGLVGGTVAAYGTILVGVAATFHLSVATAGVTLSANFVGAVLGVLACWWALRHVPGRCVLAAALAAFALGLALAALAPTWPTFVVAIALAGVGFGGIDVGMLTLLSRTQPDHRAWRLSVTGSGWAIGAIVGPLLVAVVHLGHYDLLLGVGAGLALALIALLRGVHAPPARTPGTTALVMARRSDRRAVVQTFLAGFCAYVALETAIAGWVATQLHGWGYAVTVGSLVTAGFWAGLALGRLGARRMLRRWHGPRIVLVGLGCAVVLLLAASVRWLAPLAYPVVGVALAAAFPLGLHWFTELSPDDNDGVASLVLIGMLGGILGSAAENVAVAAVGTWAVSVVAAGLAALCLAVFASALRFRIDRASPLGPP